MVGPQDYPSSEDEEYIARVMIPLAQGDGVACFFAWQEDDMTPNAITARYTPGHGAAIDPDPMTRAREAVRGQFEAREIAATMGFEALVT